MAAAWRLKVSDSGEKIVHTSFVFLPSSYPSPLGNYALEYKLGKPEKLKNVSPRTTCWLQLISTVCDSSSSVPQASLLERSHISNSKRQALSHLHRKCLYSRVAETCVLLSVLPLFLGVFDQSVQPSLSSVPSSESSSGSFLSVMKERRLRGGTRLITWQWFK